MHTTIMIEVKGTVQGVGYRRFVFKSALNNHIHGHVAYQGKESVIVLAQATLSSLNRFVEMCKKPPIREVNITHFSINEVKSQKVFSKFVIKSSKKKKASFWSRLTLLFKAYGK